MPDKLDLSGVKPIRPMSENDVTKAYVESMIMLPAILQALIEQLADMADSMSVIALFCEKKGLGDGLFTEDDLSGEDGEAEPNGK